MVIDGDARLPRRCIAVVTGTRAEYGLLSGLIRELSVHPRLAVALVVTGTHLSPEFGQTVADIERDGFPIAARCDITMSGDTPAAICTSMGLALIKFGDVFAQIQPDVLVLLGDRYEALAAACAGLVSRIPIAHIHGGETSEGAIDEAMRHAITKMASLHFTASQAYTRRVVQLGEDPDTVFTVGAMAYDNARRLPLLSFDELQTALGFTLSRPFFLISYHPTTQLQESPAGAFTALLSALDDFPDISIVMTKSNADTGGRVINALMTTYAEKDPGRIHVVASLGQIRYLSALRDAAVLIGNSSSGIIEAPLLGTPSVNLGDRQRGRLRTSSILDCAEITADIVTAIQRAMCMDRDDIREAGEALYGSGGGVSTIIDVLERSDLGASPLKTFHDLHLV